MEIKSLAVHGLRECECVTVTDVIQLTLTLKMTTAQVVETSVTVNNNSPIQDYVHAEDHTQPTYEMTPRFKPFTELPKYSGKCYQISKLTM